MWTRRTYWPSHVWWCRWKASVNHMSRHTFCYVLSSVPYFESSSADCNIGIIFLWFFVCLTSLYWSAYAIGTPGPCFCVKFSRRYIMHGSNMAGYSQLPWWYFLFQECWVYSVWDGHQETTLGRHESHGGHLCHWIKQTSATAPRELQRRSQRLCKCLSYKVSVSLYCSLSENSYGSLSLKLRSVHKLIKCILIFYFLCNILQMYKFVFTEIKPRGCPPQNSWPVLSWRGGVRKTPPTVEELPLPWSQPLHVTDLIPVQCPPEWKLRSCLSFVLEMLGLSYSKF